MKQDRMLIISRKYQKDSNTHDLFIAQILESDVSGDVFQYELWLNNAERNEKRVTSGNAYTVRRAFISKLMDLQEDGWSKRGSATYGSPHVAFFDPAGL